MMAVGIIFLYTCQKVKSRDVLHSHCQWVQEALAKYDTNNTK